MIHPSHPNPSASPTSAAAYNLVVIGGGLAGLSCAARAAELGLAVQVLEQGADEHYPCNSRYSGGMFHLNHLDIGGPLPELEAALRRMVPADIAAEVIVAIGVNARRCVQWLQDHAAARFVRVGPAHFEKWVLAPPRPPKAGLVHPGLTGPWPTRPRGSRAASPGTACKPAIRSWSTAATALRATWPCWPAPASAR